MALTRVRNRMTAGASVCIVDYGARLDGVTDDTAALQAAINAASASGRPLFIPGGACRVTGTITLPGVYDSSTLGGGLTVYGEGETTRILHAFNDRLFTCAVTLPTFIDFLDLKIVSTTPKGTGSHAFYFGGGLARSSFVNLRLGHNGDVANSPAGLFDCAPSSTTDTIVFQDCYLESVAATGYGIGKGSSVWFEGGRVVGVARSQGRGIHLYGGNGGVWLDAIDIIQIGEGMRVSADNGTSNREVFINQAALDSCHVGLRIKDDSYCEVSGVWAASCNEANILVDPGATGLLILSGGTIFNAGIYAEGGANDGIAISGGSLVKIDNVVIRNNLGIGVRSPSASFPTRGTLTNCTVSNNGTGASVGGTFDVSYNTFFGNTVTNLVETTPDTLRIVGNTGINPAGAMVSPAVPASEVNYTYVGNYDVDVYIREGTVTGVFLNDTAVFTKSEVSLRISRGDKIKIQYTVAPNWVWIRR